MNNYLKQWTSIENKMEYQKTIVQNMMVRDNINIETFNRKFVNIIHKYRRKLCSSTRKEEDILTKKTRDLMNLRQNTRDFYESLC